MGDHLANVDEYKPVWKNRRAVIFWTLWSDFLMVWSCGMAGLVAAWYDKLNTGLGTLLICLAMASIGRSVLVIGSYVFGAIWDDKNFMQMLGAGGKSK